MGRQYQTELQLTSENSPDPEKGFLSSVGGKIFHLIYGDVALTSETEGNYFRYFCMMVLTIIGIVTLSMFNLFSDKAPFLVSGQYIIATRIACIVDIFCFFVLRGKPERTVPVAILHLISAYYVHFCALFFNGGSEIRLLWFISNMICTFLTIGRIGGVVSCITTISLLVYGQMTGVFTFKIQSIMIFILNTFFCMLFMFIYNKQSDYYFRRMSDANRRLRHQASRDPLTGLHNARSFYENANALITQAIRQKQPYSILFIDLDHFKQINDRFGHAAGDHVLKSCAHEMESQLRRSDILGRIGGEEFAAFLPQTDQQTAARIAETLRYRLEILKPELDGKCLFITASIGVAGHETCSEASDIAPLLAQSDQAMYEAKQGGRNRVTLFSSLAAADA